jgi:hypothetical protein
MRIQNMSDNYETPCDTTDIPGEARMMGHHRRNFLRRAAMTTMVVPAVGAITHAVSAASRAGEAGPLPQLYKKSNAHQFEQIQADENAHVAFLVNALGNSARPMPVFQSLEQPSVHRFARVARLLENTGVAAYLGALPVLGSTTAGQQYIGAAGSIALIEGRHAGYLNTLIDLSVVENISGNVSSFDPPLTPEMVVSIVSPFLENLNGGPPLIPAGGLIAPIDILNFALALEYLEAEFYNINVPHYLRSLSS